MKRKKRRSSSVEDVKEYAYTLLAKRDYTESNLNEKLKKRGYPRSIALKVIRYLRGKEFLDDERFAFKYARLRLMSKPRGACLLDRELQKKGICRSLSKKVVLSVYRKNGEIKLAREVLRRKIANSLLADRKKAYRVLLRLGFKLDTILLAIKERFKDE